MQATVVNYPWAKELEKTVVHSLTTSFGLDFLLFKDKKGGEVDTIHNVRKDIYATDKEKERYENIDKYDRKAFGFDKNENFINQGRIDSKLQKNGGLIDGYTGNILLNKKGERHLDHIISAKEIHDDPGRTLAELDSVKLASHKSNLQSTHASINTSKSSLSVNDFLEKLPERIENSQKELIRDQKKLEEILKDTPAQKDNARKLEGKIKNTKAKIRQLQSIDIKAIREKDEEARSIYNIQINKNYYTSSKFFQQTIATSGVAGLKMGTRQMLGLVLAEVWFELREKIPLIFEKSKKDFRLECFIESIQQTLKGIWHRIQVRFQDFLIGFKEGVFSGVFASATTTLFNIFATTQKAAIKIIREMWGQLVKAIKLIVFNPDQLSFVDLSKAVIAVLSAGVAAVVGSMVYADLLPLCSFPFGNELVAFIGAFVTGIVTLGLNYFLLHSEIATKAWNFVESIMPHAGTVKKFQEINAELDRYLTELGCIEFNLDADELVDFSRALSACNNEMERGIILKDQIAKRGIELPYEMGNSTSTRNWLASLAK